MYYKSAEKSAGPIKYFANACPLHKGGYFLYNERRQHYGKIHTNQPKTRIESDHSGVFLLWEAEKGTGPYGKVKRGRRSAEKSLPGL